MDFPLFVINSSLSILKIFVNLILIIFSYECLIGRQWVYQTCTEFGFFQTSTARPNLFSDTFPVDFFIDQCADIFGPR